MRSGLPRNHDDSWSDQIADTYCSFPVCFVPERDAYFDPDKNSLRLSKYIRCVNKDPQIYLWIGLLGKENATVCAAEGNPFIF